MEQRFNRCLGCLSEINEGDKFCQNCGWNIEEGSNDPHQLRASGILNGKYIVGRTLGQGGFGITYIGWDLNLHVKVAIKEYFPDGFVAREQYTHTTVLPFTGDAESMFERGRTGFLNEAQILAKFSEENCIVSVKDYFLENGTAYIVMDYIDGTTLKDVILNSKDSKIEAQSALEMLRPIFKGLQNVHDAGLLHRDISPDNIMVLKEGGVKLLDFGAAREMSLQGEKSNTINVKHGFAPEEQYRTHGEQGPWTDIYSLAATIYRAITGVIPLQSLERIVSEEPLETTLQLGADVTSQQSAALNKALAVRGKDRFRTVSEFERALYIPGEFYSEDETKEEEQLKAEHMPASEQEAAQPSSSTVVQEKSTVTEENQPAVEEKKKNKWLVPGIVGVVVAVAAVIIFVIAGPLNSPTTPTPIGSESPMQGEEQTEQNGQNTVQGEGSSANEEQTEQVAFGLVGIPDVGKFFEVSVEQSEENGEEAYKFEFPGIHDFSLYIDLLKLTTDNEVQTDGLDEGEILRVTNGNAVVKFVLTELDPAQEQGEISYVSVYGVEQSNVNLEKVEISANYLNNNAINIEDWIAIGNDFNENDKNFAGMVVSNYANGSTFSRYGEDVYFINPKTGDIIFNDVSDSIASTFDLDDRIITYSNYLNVIGENIYFCGGHDENSTALYMTSATSAPQLILEEVKSFVIIGDHLFYEHFGQDTIYLRRISGGELLPYSQSQDYAEFNINAEQMAATLFIEKISEDAARKIGMAFFISISGYDIEIFAQDLKKAQIEEIVDFAYYGGKLYFIDGNGVVYKMDAPVKNIPANLEFMVEEAPGQVEDVTLSPMISGLVADSMRVYAEIETEIISIDVHTKEIVSVAQNGVENPQPIIHNGQEWLFMDGITDKTLLICDYNAGETSSYF